MKVLFKYLHLLSLSLSGALILCIVFAANPEIAEGTSTGKMFWLHFTVLLLAFSVLLMEVTVKKSNFTFTLPDGLLLFFSGLILITYNYTLNPQPEKLLFAAQLTMLWFLLRAVIQAYPEIRLFFISIIICTGVFEAFWGMGHLYGGSFEDHPLLRESGLVFSSGPLSGYLAVVLPICLSMALRFRDCDKIAWWETRTMLFYLSVIGVIVILIALPGGASRPAWLAAIASCCWVFFLRRSGWKALRNKVIKHSKTVVIVCASLFLFLATLPSLDGLFYPDKSATRMLMWNVTTKAILEQPMTGTGLGSFSVSYAKTQANYFASEEASDIERQEACCPNLIFNEFLQIGLEFGIVGLLLFCLWIGFTLYYGLKNKQIAATGGIIALLFLSMYSYPLHLPSFWVLLIFLSTICVTIPGKLQKPSLKSYPHIGTFAALVACVLFFGQRSYYESYREWKILRTLEQKCEYKIAAQGYRSLYPNLSHRVEFLKEGARCFHRNKQFADAVIWSRRALLLTANPEFYDIMADSHRQLGLYQQAEKCLLQSLHIMPERINTYYLLTKLYAEHPFYQPDKLKLAANSVLTCQPGVKTSDIIQMKEEAHKLLQTEIADKKVPDK